MEKAIVLAIVLICAFLLVRKAFRQITNGKCSCGCDDDSCCECSKSSGCIMELAKNKTQESNK